MLAALTARMPRLAMRVRWVLWRSVRAAFGSVLRAVRVMGRPREHSSVNLAIDSGAVSWGFIDYQELLASAEEYLGKEHVTKVIIEDRERYLREVRRQIRHKHITHYFYDPRSSSELPIRSWLQAIGLSVLLSWRGIVPIARLTDVPVRRWRAQTTLATSVTGTCLVLMDPSRVRQWCAHRSLVGPLPMPLSRTTLEVLRELRRGSPVNRGSVVFAGSLYEPRTTFLHQLAARLREHSVELELRTRVPGQPRTSNEDYWRGLASAEVIFTTADQESGPKIDHIDEPHLIYRYLEACAIGRPLVAQRVEGAEEVFTPNDHFVVYEGLEGAVESILRLLQDPALAVRVAEAGVQRAEQLVATNYFWSELNRAIGGTLR